VGLLGWKEDPEETSPKPNASGVKVCPEANSRKKEKDLWPDIKKPRTKKRGNLKLSGVRQISRKEMRVHNGHWGLLKRRKSVKLVGLGPAEGTVIEVNAHVIKGEQGHKEKGTKTEYPRTYLRA